MPKRLGSKNPLSVENTCDQVYVNRHASMEEAVDRFTAGSELLSSVRPKQEMGYPTRDVARKMLSDDSNLPQLLEAADRLMDDAILLDPRLAKKSAWVRDEHGLDGCAALIAMGDERPFLNRRKVRVAEASTAEPVRIVISTDSKEVKPENAIAFIAAAKLAQQFRPLEIWWQGAWLIEDGKPGAGNGFVILAPLIQGDLDFRRLQFVLSDKLRDSASYRVMFSYAWPKSMTFGGGAGQYSYLPETFDFIRETGIKATAEQVAAYAARWAGMEPLWQTETSGYEASQWWAAPTQGEPYKPDPKRQREGDRQYRHEQKRREREERDKAKERLGNVA